MRYIRFDNFRQSRPPNPLVQLLGLVVGIIVFVAAVLLGGIVLAAIIGFFLIAGVILYVRVWWLTRKAGLKRPGRQRGDRQRGRRQAGEDVYVEAEYDVIDSGKTDDERR